MKKIMKNGIVTALVLGVSVSAVAVAFGESDNESFVPGAEVVIEPSAETVEVEIESPTETADSVVAPENDEEKINDVRALKIAPDCNSATKDDIFHMMLNTVDYFNKASGTFIFNCSDPNNRTIVDFQTNMPDTTSYSEVKHIYVDGFSTPISMNSDSVTADQIVYCQNNDQITLNEENKTYNISPFSTHSLESCLPIKDEDRITTAPDGMPCYSYRSNPTNVEFSSMCLLPQEITIGFLQNQELWEIEGVKEFSGLDCYVIHGKTSEDYGAKLNVAEFEFLVDVNTGVLVRYEGFDANGNLSDFMYTENLKFDDSAESVQKYSETSVEGYSET